MVRHAEHRHPIERGRHASHIFIGARHEKAVRRARGIERLAQSAARQDSVVEIGCRHHQHIDLSTECADVETHRRAASPCIAVAARPVARRDGDPGRRAREHREARAPASVARRPSAPPVRARVAPSLTTTTPSPECAGARNPGSESRVARPTSSSMRANVATIGVLPLPPTERLPTLMTGRSRLRLDCGCRSYHERLRRATRP